MLRFIRVAIVLIPIVIRLRKLRKSWDTAN